MQNVRVAWRGIVRGGGGGELRSMGMNGRFDSIGVERLSPAAFTPNWKG
jgi:hypothetical protein